VGLQHRAHVALMGRACEPRRPRLVLNEPLAHAHSALAEIGGTDVKSYDISTLCGALEDPNLDLNYAAA
jgi:hypothetical protein